MKPRSTVDEGSASVRREFTGAQGINAARLFE